ncbi:MAG: PepSY-associated TM helix domain-containing protein [Verrucomicrobiaceae bacterium]|nr:PepSY-associated TM helix domain-containing protein [Verrucomicrobiaceae bacterium]
MKSTHLILRRTHSYLGMLLIPWFFVYGLSTFTFNHADTFDSFYPDDPQFVPDWEKSYTLAEPLRDDNLRAVASRIITDQSWRGAFSVQKQGRKLVMYVQNFMRPMRLTYDLDQHKLTAEKKKFAWIEVLRRMHFRAGYNGTGAWANVWPMVVDVFCVSMLMWILTGLYLWWKIRVSRTWGWITIGAGFATIALLLALI